MAAPQECFAPDVTVHEAGTRHGPGMHGAATVAAGEVIVYLDTVLAAAGFLEVFSTPGAQMQLGTDTPVLAATVAVPVIVLAEALAAATCQMRYMVNPTLCDLP